MSNSAPAAREPSCCTSFFQTPAIRSEGHTSDQDSKFPPHYKGRCLLRVIGIALYAIVLTVGILALSNNLLSFPQQLANFLYTVNWVNTLYVTALSFVFISGAAFLIHRVIHKQDRLTKAPLNQLSGDAHWVSACYSNEKRPDIFRPCYIDTSSLDQEKSGYAYMYIYKKEEENFSISLGVLAGTPLHMLGAMVYNLIRLPIIPFYILGCMAAKKEWDGKAFHFSDIPKEMGKTLFRICQAPFYALAILFATLYSFCDPLNGRKLVSALERDWNDDVSRAEGFWSVRGPQKLWRWEGGGSPNGLGKNGFFLPGCWQPIGVVHYEKGKIVYATSLTKAVDPTKGDVYHVKVRPPE